MPVDSIGFMAEGGLEGRFVFTGCQHLAKWGPRAPRCSLNPSWIVRCGARTLSFGQFILVPDVTWSMSFNFIPTSHVDEP